MCAVRPDLQDARVVPWADWGEWDRLRSAVEEGDVEAAEAHAAVYRLRRAGGLPVAVQAGVSLVAHARAAGGAYGERLALALTLTRLVNGLTDRLQPTGAGARARSVRALAEELRLPSQLVALRHTTCHNALPGSAALADGAVAAARWLDEHYWAPQEAAARKERAPNALRAAFDPLAPAQSAVEVPAGPGCGQGALQRMQEMLAKAEGVRGRRAARGAVQKDGGFGAGAKKRRWAECGNEEMWKKMPLGLCPWQTEVHTYLTCADELGEQDSSSGDDRADGEVSVSEKPAKLRRLQPDEQEYVNKMRLLMKGDIEEMKSRVKE